VTILDRLITWISPKWGQSRARARMMVRHYQAASFGRRTDGWSRRATDANTAASGATLSLLRSQARDLIRNNSWARKGLRRILGNTVGWGIRPKPTGRTAKRIAELWKLWAETTQCDAAGRLNFYGLQRQAMRTIAESGEVIIRRRRRLPQDGLAIPLQLQILEPDYLDSTRDGIIGEAGGPIIQGVEFDAIGRRVAYWLFDQHPGGQVPMQSPASRRVPAEGILHVYDQERAGQVRGPSWFACVSVRLADFAEFEDATLVKQKIAACMTAFVTDLDGSANALALAGTDSTTGQATDTFEPGAIIPLPVGKTVTLSNPPAANDHQSFTASSLRGVAAGLPCITYEDLTGDYSQVNYSSARMARIGARADRDDLIWNMLVPQLCQPVWNWMQDAMILAGEKIEAAPAEWSPAPMPMLDPKAEAEAYRTMIRNGLMTLAQAIRELGYDPLEQLTEISDTNDDLDKFGIILDCDPRKLTSAGAMQLTSEPADPAEPAATSGGSAVGDGAELPTTTH
jgi:lambda family phage portal protein